MLVEIAIGDAYGAPFEYCDPGPGRPNDLSGYWRHLKHDLGGGRYTDDTQMTLAVAETIVRGRTDRRSFAQAFVDAFHRDRRVGYAARFYDFLLTCKSGDDLLARISPYSDKSGAAMRACPVGLLPDVRQVLDVAEVQARITHDTPGGIASAQAVALMVFAMRNGECARTELPAYLASHLPGPWQTPWTGKVGSSGMDSVRAALAAVVSHGSLSDMLKHCIAFRGDVDTVAAVAMGVASVSPDVVSDLPQVLYDGLEDGTYGRTAIEDLDAALFRRYAPGMSPAA